MSRRPLRHLLALVALIMVTLGWGAGAAAVGAPHTPVGAEAQDRATGATILIGTGGLIWSDVSESATPNLWQLVRDSSTATMAVRSVNPTTCPVDGWLQVSAGERASAPSETGALRRAGWMPCPEPSPVVDGQVAEWDSYLWVANELRFNARLGALGDAAADQGVCISAIGPGAPLGAARSDGSVEHVMDFETERLSEGLTLCPITLVDIGSLPQHLTGAERTARLSMIDHRIAQVLSTAPAGANIIVGSLADDGRQSRLRIALAKGPDFGPGVLLSPSTRQPGLILKNDLTSSLLGLTGLTVPRTLNGGVLTSEPAADDSDELADQRFQELLDYDLASFKVRSLVPTFFQTFIWGQLVIYLLVLLVWKGKLGSADTRNRWLGLARVVAVSAASVPAATFLANLIPWWRTNWPMPAIVGAVALWTTIIAVLALAGPWGRSALGPVFVVSAVTVLVLGLDVMTGSRLQLSSLMGLQPAIGGRYFGMGNVPFALFVTSAMFLCIVVADALLARERRVAAAWATGTILVVALIINGAPMWGADAGGPLSLPVAIAFFVLTLLGVRITLRRWILLFIGTGLVFLTVAFLDSLRPIEKQSHLGRFIDSLLDGSAIDIFIRKAEQNWGVLTSNYSMTILVPFALAFVIYVLARETSWGSRALQRSFDRFPALRPGLLATLIVLTVGFFVNDSGVAIPAVGATIAVPLLIAINVWVLRHEVTVPAQAEVSDEPVDSV